MKILSLYLLNESKARASENAVLEMSLPREVPTRALKTLVAGLRARTGGRVKDRGQAAIHNTVCEGKREFLNQERTRLLSSLKLSWVD